VVVDVGLGDGKGDDLESWVFLLVRGSHFLGGWGTGNEEEEKREEE
jgi:hypothetical protein